MDLILFHTIDDELATTAFTGSEQSSVQLNTQSERALAALLKGPETHEAFVRGRTEIDVESVFCALRAASKSELATHAARLLHLR